MKTVLALMGTRPEVIKLAPLTASLSDFAEVKVCATAQHRLMQDQMLELFNIKPDVDLDLMRPGQDLFYLTSQLLTKLQQVFLEIRPDLVLVQGDTTTCFAGALAAFYANIPVGHVEAGLRSFNKYAPFPEEINRVMTGSLAELHFAPTASAKQHLLDQGIAESKIFVTGNTVIDALLQMQQRLPVTENVEGPYVLITGHRRESFGAGFVAICDAIAELARRYTHYKFIYPVHLNPNVQQPVRQRLSSIKNIKLIEPLEYLPFLQLMQNCDFVLTDSGGVQEEAPTLGKPVLVMRDNSERMEGVIAGTAKLVGTNCASIIDAVSTLIEDRTVYSAMSQAGNPYGDGTAAAQIAEIIFNYLQAGYE